MKLLAVICVFGVLSGACSEELNADSLRDFLAGHHADEQAFKRSVLNSAALGLDSVAKSFVSNIGLASASGQKMSSGFNSAFTDSCLKSDSNIFNPIVKPWNPLPWNNNPFGGGVVVTKRADKLANRDYVFVLDTSASIPADQFKKAVDAVATLVESFCPQKMGSEISSEGTKQVAVVMFGTRTTIDISFEDSHKGLGFLKDKIRSLVHRKDGGTSTAAALKFVKNSVIGKGFSRVNHKDVSTDVIVITDGQCNQQCSSLGVDADALRSMGHGVNVFALGVAKSRACELEIISGKGDSLSYGLGDFQEFDKFAVAVAEIAKESTSKCA